MLIPLIEMKSANISIKEYSNFELPVEAFYVANSRDTTVQMGNDHKFDKVFINKGFYFDPATSTAKLGKHFYWIALTVTSKSYLGELNSSRTEFRQDPRPEKLITSQYQLKLHRPQSVIAQKVLHTTVVNGDINGTETSWLGFLIKNGCTFAGFSNSIHAVGLVNFQWTDLFEFRYENGKMIPEQAGYFYMSYTFPTRRSVSVILKIGGSILPQSEINVRSLSYLSTGSASKSLILKLERNDELSFEVTEGMIFASEKSETMLNTMILSFSSHFASVERRNDFIALEMTKFYFQVIQVNEGDSWDEENDYFKCKSEGIYKISMSLGARYNFQLEIEILKNDDVIGRIKNIGNEDRETRVISRSLLVDLQVSDTVSVRGIGMTDVSVTSTVFNIFKL